MKLKHECVRATLLFIEENYQDGSNLMLNDFIQSKELKSYDQQDVAYTLKKLDEAGYLNIKFVYASNQLAIVWCWGITWSGHEFLDTVRDTKVWSETKSITSKFASVPIKMVSDIASKVLTNLIEKQMGL
ncbi:DUF2513 domain-containing protein [Leuconostoc citreum]|uniref:DUF2513 domain-containing protein n=1 Tax=Leuconostoc citreum TaxID=33964 RepID=UPI00105EAA90|nr:DUF2513 domain-containing protein [Leuconostoc citreum]MCT3072549.1 DUF2513 domain-containing protein [Leuconostoc citreum]TDM36259.1 hypothetical protein CMW49_04175 [Leuconostoc citreum]TPF03046.1 hypothetical protein DIS11_04170 [Leuconostoc citreum]